MQYLKSARQLSERRMTLSKPLQQLARMRVTSESLKKHRGASCRALMTSHGNVQREHDLPGKQL